MTALTLMSEATLVLDEHGGVVAANDLAQEMFGYGGEALAAQPVTELMPLAMPLAGAQEEGGPPRRIKLEGRPLVPVGGRADVEVVADALVTAVRECGEPRVTVSAGVAAIDEATQSADNLLVSADRAMYSVKRRGGDGFAFA